MNRKIWLSPPHMSGHEQNFIDSSFKSNWITSSGPNLYGFELALEEYLKRDSHVALLNSGTAAIHLALILLGVTAKDEVICQSNTFSASANPIVYQGATPIFIDSELNTWNMSPKLLAYAIKDRIKKGKKPKAIIAVHLYGMPYKVKEIHEIANHYNIPIIEDSAEALGSSYNSQKCGTFGNMGILSFNGNKIITTSGGGALICSSKEVKNKTIYLSTQAKDEGSDYLHSNIGYNYRMSNVIAGIGRGQMKVLDHYVDRRRKTFCLYNEQLNLNYLSFLKEPDKSFSNRWLTCVLTESFERREGLRLYLKAKNIESRPMWRPMHQQPIFKEAPSYKNGISDDLFEKGLCLPSGSSLTENDLSRIINTINSYFQ